MSTGHRRTVSKRADTTTATHLKPHRFIRSALLRAGIFTAIGLTTLSLGAKAQSAGPNPTPKTKLGAIMAANAAREKDMTKTYDASKDFEASGKEKTENKWCDGLVIEKGTLIFNGVGVRGKNGDVIINIKNLLDAVGIADATTENIKWQEFRIISGEKKAYFVVETKTSSVLITVGSDFEKSDETRTRVIVARDLSRIFTHMGSILISDDGTVIASTPTTLLIIQSGLNGKTKQVVYNEEFGKGPAFTNPTITNSNGDDMIVDPTMPDQYILLDHNKLTIGLYDKALSIIGMK